jgi:DNA-directed RNA polymerase beta subunit
MNEDPVDPGGYFIIKGNEWVIDCIENILFNQIRIFKNEGYSKEVMRVEYVSKPGDTYQNSDYFLVRLLNDNQLTCEIVRNHLKGIQIPFYLLFRVLGWTSDKEMFDNIIYGYGSDISKNMLNYIIESINTKYSTIASGRYVYNQTDALKLIIEELKYTDFKYLELDTKPENYHIAFNKIFTILDCNFLPHIGLKPEDRPKKLRYLALIIRKLFLVKMGNMEATDRDSYKSKRVHAAGTSYAKTFKTYFNASIIQQIKRRLIKDFRSMTFSQVDLAASVKSSVYGADFERSIMQTITSGNKSQITVNKKARINRLSSQLLDRKNQIAVYSTLRQVTTTSTESSKQSERANEMRRVHMSFLGYICCIHSSDGEKVGINKQLAIFASILGATSSEVIKDILMRDKMVIPLDTISTNMIYEKDLRNVYVNGEWIGCTKDCLELVKKYRKSRRNFEINPLTTIYWDNTQDEALFWVDVGRVVRPLMIVYNNKRDPEIFSGSEFSKTKKFKQGLGITKKTLDGLKSKTIDMEYLIKNNLVEYITPEEQENCYLCPFFDQLKTDQNNELNEYTHCDIPQAILGLTALTSPFSNHNQVPRITFQTSQCRQTCGIFALNWPYRCDKDSFLQYICETPLVKTVASKYVFPNGSNAIVAIMCYSGYNQEDSIVVSQGAVDRGLFDGSKFTFYKTELEQREEFGNPDIATTSDIKAGSYAKLKDGIIKRGSKINKGDAIIGKYMKVPKTADNDMSMSDRSVIYKENEEALVHNVIINRNEDDEQFCKVSVRKVRPVAIGDKFCLTGDHEVLTTHGWKNITQISLADKIATLNQTTKNIEFQNPTDIPTFEHNGEMYSVKARGVDLITTLNHKMYVRRNLEYNLEEAQNIQGACVYYKKDGINNIYDVSDFTLPSSEKLNPPNIGNFVYPSKNINMDSWLEFLGIYLSEGWIDNSKIVRIAIYKDRVKSKLLCIINELEYDYKIYETEPYYLYIHNFQLADYLEQFGKSNIRKMPEWCYTLSRRQSLLILNSLLLGNGHYNTNHSSWEYYSSSEFLANSIQILAFMSGQTATINIKNYKDENVTIKGIETKRNSNNYRVYISNYSLNKEPLVGGATTVENIINYNGMVYCLTVPNNVFLTRRNFTYVWTGNSSRAGQKGVTGILLRDSDMPFTKDGIRPELIINPHAIPSRMTIGQLYESQTGNYCAMKGTHTDATIFKYTDIESMGNELEALGMHRYGYHRLYSGITGEHIDCMIFMGPTYYQRLQKFVIDAVYSISKGPSDVLSRQPLDGKASGGGIRIGEMERDVICSHGSSKFLQEKFFDHSDGFTEYICRCGKAATVNIKKNIYKCKYCKDNADIAAVPTSWSSKLFMQEMETMNVGIRRHLNPFTYESIQEDVAKKMADSDV